MKPTFGDWLRWTIARHGLDQAEFAIAIGASPRTVTNYLGLESPEKIQDVYVSQMAHLFDMTEPQLLEEWKNGVVPMKDPPKKPKKKSGHAASRVRR